MDAGSQVLPALTFLCYRRFPPICGGPIIFIQAQSQTEKGRSGWKPNPHVPGTRPLGSSEHPKFPAGLQNLLIKLSHWCWSRSDYTCPCVTRNPPPQDGWEISGGRGCSQPTGQALGIFTCEPSRSRLCNWGKRGKIKASLLIAELSYCFLPPLLLNVGFLNPDFFIQRLELLLPKLKTIH